MEGTSLCVVPLKRCCLSSGFIDFIVEPTFTVLTDMTEKIVSPLIDETSQTGGTGQRRSRSVQKLEGWGSGWPLHKDRVTPLGEMGVFHNDVCPPSLVREMSASFFFSEELKLYCLYSPGWPGREWPRSTPWPEHSQYRFPTTFSLSVLLLVTTSTLALWLPEPRQSLLPILQKDSPADRSHPKKWNSLSFLGSGREWSGGRKKTCKF